MTKKNIYLILTLIIGALVLSGCGQADAKNEGDLVTLKIGATPVPHVEILEHIKPELEKQGIKLEIVEFTDYVTPNLALTSKDIDANFFQHVPYMETFARERSLELENAGNVHVEPLGLYSNKFKSLEDITEGAEIAIPNDPTNEGRTLLLLQSKGLIKLKDGVSLEATSADIVENSKNLKFRPIEAAQLPRTLDDVDASVINTNYALEAGLNPVKDAIIIEGSDSPYANIITIRPEDRDDENIKKLVNALQSESVRKFIEEKYKGSVVPAF
ncbi:D-methionine transport system substrate-binding protein [Acetoanaerobium pronyense]|uniref:Lipoprotein n=1 Tax=Acetoanaerobium pronyense TaxID=1482736 RepID=A0ABS4KGC9_9FIRM|nr:MetQ/NlpA family ABC transporter substrate-binding protein [Acetoanaerobium pronyense]MBP2026837.1 D-methionine transport system substrate-binding protein [Acetoanaerobium pronyense]